MPVLELTDEQLEALKDVADGYFSTEPEIIRRAYNEAMTPNEARFRCERWNQMIRIPELRDNCPSARFLAGYSEEEIADFEEHLKDYAL